MTPTTSPRSFLFLQGLATLFFSRLGDRLAERGHRVCRINLNGGDRAYWRRPGAVDFRGRPAEWPDFLARLLARWQITDLVLFGDCRPLHRIAIEIARERSLGVHVFEEGYIRPNWTTLESGGVNGHSALSDDPAWFRERARGLPPWKPPADDGSSFLRRAGLDVAYNLAGVALAWRFAHYRTHRLRHPMLEYTGWIGKFARKPGARQRSQMALARLQASDPAYFLFPLQLEGDYQIREHSPFDDLAAAIRHVIASFAAQAPPDCLLVAKEHPLDNGLTDWRLLIREIAERCGVADRVLYLEVADAAPLLRGARGMVTINSSMGTQALAEGLPTTCLGKALYDMPGLTFQDGLDAFWSRPTPPDPELFDAFRRVLAERCLVPGGFFSPKAEETLITHSVGRLEGGAAPPATERHTPLPNYSPPALGAA